jgi:DNA-binding MarR family transcriptional regulator
MNDEAQFPQIMDYLFYRGSIGELRMLNKDDYTRGISYHSMLYLNIIAYEQNCTVSKLAQNLNITTSAAVIKVGELVKNGLVEKIRSDDDKRIQYLRLTPQTAEIYGLYTRIGTLTYDALRERYSPDELALFNKILKEVAEYEPKD